MQLLVDELRFALRFTLRETVRRPGFTVLAILTLALAIGAVTTIYSVIYSVLLNPFPYTDPRRMVDVVVQNMDATQGGIRGGLTVPEFRAYVDQSGVFEEAVGTNSFPMLYRTQYGTEQFVAAGVTPNTFHFLGVPALLGRTLTSDDAKPGAAPVAILSHKTWTSYFGADPAIPGRTIVLDNRPMTVIGVMPPHFTWNVADVWIPDAADRRDPNAMKKAFWLQGRLKRGVTFQQAQTKLNIIGQRLAHLYPERYPPKFAVKIITVIDWVVGKFRWVLYTLLGAVALLHLIACCNVANMLLARATTREREIVIRTALGAARARIIAQLLLESLFLAFTGGLAGLALAYAGTHTLVSLIPPYTIPVETDIAIKVPVLLFSLATAILTTVVFGLAPAFHATRSNLAAGLSSSGKGMDSGSRGRNFRNALIGSEVALSLVLLAGAGVLMRTFFSMLNQDLGFNPHNLLIVRMVLPNARPAQKRQFFDAALLRLGSLPGVIAVGETIGAPPPYGGITTDIDIRGTSHPEKWTGQFELCNDSYFRTVGFRLLSGSLLSHDDVVGARKVAVINQVMAIKYFGNRDPIGKRIYLARLASFPGGIADPTFEIVGVVADIRNQGLEEPAGPEAFVPLTTTDVGFPAVLVRTSSDARFMSHTIRRAIQEINHNVVQRDAISVDDLLRDRSYARPRFSVLLMSIFASIGLVLVGTGVYGVMAYVVSRRTREIGIRMALGARQSSVFRSVLGDAFRVIGIGVILGVLMSFTTNRVIASRMWKVAAFDPIVLVAGVAVLVILGGIACTVPALRATRVNPVIALRDE